LISAACTVTVLRPPARMNSTAQRNREELRAYARAAVFAGLTGAGAWIILPIGPVPITLQVLFVYLAGLLLEWRMAGLAMGLYLLLGVLGLPVFAGGGAGIGVLLGPTGGFLWGFVAAAVLVSVTSTRARREAGVASRGRTIARCAMACVIGSATFFTCGAAWGKFSTQLPWEKVLAGWILPFLPGDVIKITLASVIATEVLRRTTWRDSGGHPSA
jgi:biotin transport system substrate-specific component